MPPDRPIVPVEAKPVPEPAPPRRSLPLIVAKTVNLCVHCVVAPGRMAARIARQRFHHHYHPRHRFGRHHLATDVVFVVAILALLGLNGYLFIARPNIFPSKVRLLWIAEPATVRSGDAFTFALAFRYDGDEPLEQTTVALNTPERFAVTSVSPGTYDAATRTVRIGTLAPGVSGEIRVSAMTDAPDGTNLSVRATFHGRSATRSERAFAEIVVPVRGVAFLFDLGAPMVVRRGQTMTITASYQRVSEAAPRPEAFRLTLEGSLMRASHVVAPGATVRPGEVRWPFRDVRLVGEPIQESFMLTVPTTVDATTFPSGTRFQYTLTPEIVLASDAQGVPIAHIAGPPRILAVVGEVHVTAFARYFTPEGDQIGRGPLPPLVGATTTYWVTWDAQSILRDADHVIVRASLPPGVEWTGRVMSTVGEVPTFDAASRSVTWAVGTLDRTIGNLRPEASTSFEVAYTPTAAQAGSFAALLGETSVQGVDDLGAELATTAPAVTTELSLDQRARGNGNVTR